MLGVSEAFGTAGAGLASVGRPPDTIGVACDEKDSTPLVTML
jgi:hypothetical protein